MRTFEWQPTCERPAGLVWPTQLDRGGTAGLTRGRARGRAWRQCASGWYVPSSADVTVVEQRIVEQAARLPEVGAVTAWAALRWYGAAYFDGLAGGGRWLRPVPLVTGGGDWRIRADPRHRSSVHQDQLAPTERVVVDDLPCTTVQRALFDEMRSAGSVEEAVVAMDMAAAARLISRALMVEYVDRRPAWTGVPRVRRALALATDDSRSPRESHMRMVWEVDAELPRPLCNPCLFGLDGTLLGQPDLFDPVAGLVGEYDGADHLREDRRARDLGREDRFRDHGLEYFTVVGRHLADRDRLAARMRRVRSRARFAAPGVRRWTLEPPPWFDVPEPLDAFLRRTGRAVDLTHT